MQLGMSALGQKRTCGGLPELKCIDDNKHDDEND
jgi:hypothetical protein